MKRLKWLELFTEHATATLAQLLGKHSYNDSSLFGFELIDVSRRKIVARFIQQESITEISQNPFGENIETTYVRYTRFDFRIFKIASQYMLCLHSPPRSLRNFMSALNRALHGDVAVGEVTLDVLGFINSARKNLSSNGFKVVQAIYVDVPLTSESTCKIQISSEYDAIRAFESKLVSGRLERATIQIANHMAPVIQFDIGRKGTLHYDESQWDNLDVLDDLILKN